MTKSISSELNQFVRFREMTAKYPRDLAISITELDGVIGKESRRILRLRNR